jgi:hypothetical protein
MPVVQIAANKWQEETGHGRIIIKVSEKGIHVREVVDEKMGLQIVYDEKLVSFQSINDLANGQRYL